MDNFPKHLIAFFISFIKTQAGTFEETEKLVRRMLTMKKVQNIIIETIIKLEPIINEQIINIKAQIPSRSNPSLRESRLLTLSRDIKHQMENYSNIQESLNNVMNIVESINLNVDPIPVEPLREPEDKPELVKLLEAIAGRPKTSNFEIEEISDDSWTKHLEVEKMLVVEMQKYYENLQNMQKKHFMQIYFLKQKTGSKIVKLEEEVSQTWNHFRVMVDRCQMTYEDFSTREHENTQNEDQILINSIADPAVRDLPSAISKIKTLFAARKLLEKRKVQDDKLIKGQNNKLVFLSEKLSQLREMNMNIIENCACLSRCLEYLIMNSDVPQVVKEKISRLLKKQKCAKIESLFQVSEIFEKFSVDSMSKKYEHIKEEISNICVHIKDENIRLRLFRIVNENNLDEVDKAVAIKTAQLLKPLTTTSKRGKSSVKAMRMELSGTVKVEGVLEKLKRTMNQIDREVMESSKAVDEVIVETAKTREITRYEISISDSLMKSTDDSKATFKSLFSPISLMSSKQIEKNSKSTQIEIRTTSTETQINAKISGKVLKEIAQNSAPTISRPTSLSIKSQKHFKDRFTQTYKDKPVLELTTNPTSLIKSLMKSSKIPYPEIMVSKSPSDQTQPKSVKIAHSEMVVSKSLIDQSIMKNLKISHADLMSYKNQIDQNVTDNLIITRLEPVITESINEDLDESSNQLNISKTEFPDSSDEHAEDMLKHSKNSSQSSEPKSLKYNYTLPADTNIHTKKVSTSKLLNATTVKLIQQNKVQVASEQYTKEFALHAQAKGLKKMTFEDIQSVWEDVINRRIVDGEKDKISIHLRGYLGTDKYELEKSKMINLIAIQNNKEKTSKFKIVKSKRALENWKKVASKIIEKLSFNFRSLIKDSDSVSDILFKVARNLKFVKHRLQRKSSPKAEKKKGMFDSVKWALNSSSLSPTENSKKKKFLTRPKYFTRFLSKTPAKSKLITSETSRLPYIN